MLSFIKYYLKHELRSDYYQPTFRGSWQQLSAPSRARSRAIRWEMGFCHPKNMAGLPLPPPWVVSNPQMSAKGEKPHHHRRRHRHRATFLHVGTYGINVPPLRLMLQKKVEMICS